MSGELSYWIWARPHKPRVVFKPEFVVNPGRETKNNMRFVGTNMKQTPKDLYEFYSARGDAVINIDRFPRKAALLVRPVFWYLLIN